MSKSKASFRSYVNENITLRLSRKDRNSKSASAENILDTFSPPTTSFVAVPGAVRTDASSLPENVVYGAGSGGVTIESDAPEPLPEVVDGEIIISKAQSVLKFDTFSGQNRGISGSLFCTNFKVSFVPSNKPDVKIIELDRRNRLFKDNDIPLTSIESINQVGGSRRRQLLPKIGNTAPKEVEIRMKNFKIFTFSFKFTHKPQIKSIMAAMLHHAHPSSPELLFAFTFQPPLSPSAPISRKAVFSENQNHAIQTNGIAMNGMDSSRPVAPPRKKKSQSPQPVPHIRFLKGEKNTPDPPALPPKPGKSTLDWTIGKTPLFTNRGDWQTEMDRWGVRGLRVTHVNRDFLMCSSLPEYFVVPDGLSDVTLAKACQQFEGQRAPAWCWSHSNEASLFRMVPLHPNTDLVDVETRVLETIFSINPGNQPIHTIDLSKCCPSIKELQAGFLKLKDLCTTETLKEFSSTDGRWISGLDSSRWFYHISSCLLQAKNAAEVLEEGDTVVLKEISGFDFSCVISSLTQILLDAHYRTQLGFQSLVQREWVAMGHPFMSRSGHCGNNPEEESPVFLLFLDCVHQLLLQYPFAFEFTDTFLITIWDSVHSGIFGNFVFDNERERTKYCTKGSQTVSLASVWAWTLQFTNTDQTLFTNPLYLVKEDLQRYRNKLQVPPEVDDREGCNAGIYRAIKKTSKSDIVGSFYANSPKHSKGKRLPSSNSSTSLSSVSSSRTSESTSDAIMPDHSVPSIHFWIHCYLRWVPSVHLVGGGEIALYRQYCYVVGEIQELFKELESFHDKEQPQLKSRCLSNKLYATSIEDLRNAHKCITSAFPFTTSELEFLAGDRRSFLSSTLAKFLQGESLLDSDQPDKDLGSLSPETDSVREDVEL